MTAAVLPEGTGVARALWAAVERIHRCYSHPAGDAVYGDVGLLDGWDRYFAARASPLGAASAELVAATFYVFAPRLVARSLPDVWARAAPDAVRVIRTSAADAGVRASFPALLGEPSTAAADHARRIVESLEPHGRPLFASHAALEPPDAPHLQLWWYSTLLREYRGDGHIACLVARGVGPCESVVFHGAAEDGPSELIGALRGWTEDEIAAAEQALRDRGWLEGDELTEGGRAARAGLEADTDRLALPEATRDRAAALLQSLPPLRRP